MAGPRHCPAPSRTRLTSVSEEEDGPSSVDSGVSVDSYMGDQDEMREVERRHHGEWSSSWPSAKLWFVNQIDLGMDLETILRPHFHYLCQNTSNVAMMMEFWYADFRFTADETSHVVRNTTTYLLCNSLYAAAVTRNAGDKLLEAWTLTDNHHIVQYLKDNTTAFLNHPISRQVSTTESIVTTVATQCSLDIESDLDGPPSKPADDSPLMNDVSKVQQSAQLEGVKKDKHLRPRWKMFCFCVCLVTILVLLLHLMVSAMLLSNSLHIEMHDGGIAESATKCTWLTSLDDDGVWTGEVDEDGTKNEKEEEEEDREVFITIDSPTTKFPAPQSTKVVLYLTIVNRETDMNHENENTWLRLDLPSVVAGSVSTLTLMGIFGDAELAHFCQLFPNLVSVYSLLSSDTSDGDTWNY